MKFPIGVFFFEKSVKKVQGLLKSYKNDGYFTRRPIYVFDHISLSSSWNEKFWNKFCTENQNTHFTLNIFFFENRAVYEITWKNMVQPKRPQMTIWCMRIAARIPEAKNTHLEYVILFAFARQQWLHERASMLRYTYTACLVRPHIALCVPCESGTAINIRQSMCC